MSYCICAWGGAITSTYNGRRIKYLHEKLVFKLFNRFYHGNSDIFKYFNLLKLDDIYKYFVGIHMYELVRLRDNPSLLECIEIEYRNHSYETRGRNFALIPRPRLEVEKINFKYNFIKIWNEIPVSIANSDSIESFKYSLKIYFCNQYGISSINC